MKKTLSGIAALVIFVYIGTRGLIEPITNFFLWLVKLNMTQSNVSIAGDIFVRVATFLVSYAVVGFIFESIGWFNSDAMKVVYFIVSTLVSFALCYVVMILETYKLEIAIGIGVIIVALIITGIILYIKNRDDKKELEGK